MAFEGSTSFLKTFYNAVNALSGVGILSISYALSSGGWLTLILFLGLGVLTFYTAMLLKRCMKINNTILTYPDIGQVAFGNRGRVIVALCLYIDLYLVATGLLIIEGDNWDILWPNVGFNIGKLYIGHHKLFVMAVSVVMLPLVWLNDLRILSYISASGIVATFVTLGSILWAGFGDRVGFRQRGELLNWSGLPRAVSLYTFCYCIHPLVPTLRTSMENEQDFVKVLLLCFSYSIIMYTSMAVCGYLMFGSKLLSQITLNMPTGHVSSQVAIYTTLVNPLAKYALMMSPVMNAIEGQLPQQYRGRRWFCIMIRTAVVFSSTAVAVLVPFFGYLMALVGATFDIALAIFLPCLCYWKIVGTQQISRLERTFIGIIVFIGIVVMISGTYTSIVDIVKHL